MWQMTNLKIKSKKTKTPSPENPIERWVVLVDSPLAFDVHMRECSFRRNAVGRWCNSYTYNNLVVVATYKEDIYEKL